MRRQFAILALLEALLSACSGRVVMTPANPADIAAAYANKQETDGIIVYRATPIIEVDEFTQYNQPAAGNTTKLSDDCTHVPSRQLKTVADWDHPYILNYEHGLLESYTFGATCRKMMVDIPVASISCSGSVPLSTGPEVLRLQSVVRDGFGSALA